MLCDVCCRYIDLMGACHICYEQEKANMKQNRNPLLPPNISVEHSKLDLSVGKKREKGYRLTKKIQGSDGNLVSAVIRGGQKSQKCRIIPQASTAKTMLLATNCERSGLVGGQVILKEDAAPFSRSNSACDTKESDQGSLLKTTSIHEEMNKLEKCSATADAADMTIPALRKLHTCSEKVSKWLEESEGSPCVTRSVVDNIGFQVGSDRQAIDGNSLGLDIGSTFVEERVELVHDNCDTKELVENLVESGKDETEKVIAQALDEFPPAKGFRGLTVALLSTMATVAFSIIFMLLYLEMPTLSWEIPEPPPT